LGLPSELTLCASCWLATCQSTLLLGRFAKKRARQDENRKGEGESANDAPSDSSALVAPLDAEMPSRSDLSCADTANKRKHQSQRCGVCGKPGHKSRTCAFGKKGVAADVQAPLIASRSLE
jgi:hypothetical protein